MTEQSKITFWSLTGFDPSDTRFQGWSQSKHSENVLEWKEGKRQIELFYLQVQDAFMVKVWDVTSFQLRNVATLYHFNEIEDALQAARPYQVDVKQ